ncbi:hypothetical protein NP493_1139g00020 [Ridgeia piscesae]|uniref:Uncharacterized protein n=1 Tax=Ridgeia piscesae TaxID=27915 RepID=A0AAD9KGR5_RIDPI|nr:hypothetical protein NP493_1139g00020 [Ridgeia piscesae]
MKYIIALLLLLVAMTTCYQGDSDDDGGIACMRWCDESYSETCVSFCKTLYVKSTFECLLECSTSKVKCLRFCEPSTWEWQ